MGWSNGRELTSLSGNGKTATYTYDASGLRLSKTVNGVKTVYQYEDGKLLYEKKGDIELHYGYDSEVRRFINADDVNVLDEDQGSIVEHNLFTYCLNNPVNMMDEEGDFAITASVTAYIVATFVLSAGATVIVTERVCYIYKKGNKVYKKYRIRIKKVNNLPSVKKVKLDM